MFIENHSRAGTGFVPVIPELHGDTGRDIRNREVSPGQGRR